MDRVEDVLRGWPNQVAIVVVGMNGGVWHWESYHCDTAVVLGDPSSAEYSFDSGTWKEEAQDISGQRLAETECAVGH
jgi:hypothetical protein